MICYLQKVENITERIFVKNLEATAASKKLGQIDIKAIQWIVVKNVKYVINKGAIKLDDEEEKEVDVAWDPKKLAVGNWFS